MDRQRYEEILARCSPESRETLERGGPVAQIEAAQVLECAAKRVETAWQQGGYFADGWGISAGYLPIDGTACCLTGALRWELTLHGQDRYLGDELEAELTGQIVLAALAALLPGGVDWSCPEMSLICWNDIPGRRQIDVVCLLREAAEFLRLYAELRYVVTLERPVAVARA